MVTKEQIQETMDVLLETFPKIKEIILEGSYDIRKKENGWDCFMTVNYNNQFDQPSFVYTDFDKKGNPTEMSIHDYGRPRSVIISKDVNGKFIAKNKD
ncbi:hypothetical protein [Flavobacterium sp.]|uniref:hypothetical protein n=1 Tax=Flavobacterium sp. TaxID=239 RepID=UPI002FDDB006